MRETERFITMDGLRGAAAFSVMLMHIAPGFGASWAPNAGLAVDIFFCLSGFVLAGACDGPESGDFLRRRWARLYPLYAIGLALGIVVHVWALALGAPISGIADTMSAVLAGALFLPVLFSFTTGFGNSFSVGWPYPFNPPAWSLFYELAVNAVFARFHPRGWRLAAGVAAFALVFLAVTLCARGIDDVRPFASGAPRALFGFYAGLGLRTLADAGALPRWRWQGFTPLVVAAAAVFTSALDPAARAVFVLAISPMAVALCVAEPPGRLLSRAYTFAGRISYPLYVLHWPMFKLARLAWASAFGLTLATPEPLGFFALYLIALVLLCATISGGIEGRMRAALLRLSERKTTGGPERWLETSIQPDR